MKQIFAIAVLLFMAITAMAQVATVKKTAGFTGKYPIVRDWNEDYSVVYAQSSTSLGCFMLEDHSSTSALVASLPPQHWVTDFEILNDTVYLCGYWDNPGVGKTAFVGLFGIDELFHHGGAVLFVHVGNATPLGYSYYEQFTIPTRMDVYDFNGAKHIVTVGDCELSPVPGQAPSSTIADIALSGGVWTGHMLFNKRHHEHYTDIVATPNYVIATARSADSNACYLKPFYKSANILATPLTLGYIHQVSQGIPTGKVLVDAMERDSFSIAYHYTCMGVGASTVKMFGISGGVLNLLYSTNLVQSTTSICTSLEGKPFTNNTTSAHMVLSTMDEVNDPIPLHPTTHILDVQDIELNIDCQN